ncbi:hypothetical protein JCM6882_002182 [Rhodosporidiobolus microsporus]
MYRCYTPSLALLARSRTRTASLSAATASRSHSHPESYNSIRTAIRGSRVQNRSFSVEATPELIGLVASVAGMVGGAGAGFVAAGYRIDRDARLREKQFREELLSAIGKLADKVDALKRDISEAVQALEAEVRDLRLDVKAANVKLGVASTSSPGTLPRSPPSASPAVSSSESSFTA